MTQETLKLALEALDNLLYWDNGKPEYDEAREAITAIKEALREHAMREVQRLGQEIEQEPVALQDDEIYDAAFSAYCRGENSRELFRIMWSNRLTCSIGWDRDELKSFARNIAALYTHPREKNQ